MRGSIAKQLRQLIDGMDYTEFAEDRRASLMRRHYQVLKKAYTRKMKGTPWEPRAN